ncbi:hypothetical protein SDJN03_11380, partial [Cucurbita argyrosperma subsp. sororia]
MGLDGPLSFVLDLNGDYFLFLSDLSLLASFFAFVKTQFERPSGISFSRRIHDVSLNAVDNTRDPFEQGTHRYIHFYYVINCTAAFVFILIVWALGRIPLSAAAAAANFESIALYLCCSLNP